MLIFLENYAMGSLIGMFGFTLWGTIRAQIGHNSA